MPTLSAEYRALLHLHLLTDLGPKIMASLLAHFGTAQEVLNASVNDLLKVPHIGDKLASQFRRGLDEIDVAAEIERLDRFGVHLVFLGDSEYPQNLATISPAPQVLYVRGTLQPQDNNAIAIVGSRRCTSYGRRLAERLGYDLAQAGWTIVSGLARGIDGAAHRGALQAKGRTLAVLANGLSSIYPPEHEDLAKQVEENGALLTEFNMRMEPLPQLFPGRNRIISGLSRGVIIVEAQQKSGALITARHAGEQGREVFAVPGPVDSIASSGALQLLREGAKLVRDAKDVLEDLQGVSPLVSSEETSSHTSANTPTASQPPPNMSEEDLRIWEFVKEQPRQLDEIVQALDIPVSQLTGKLMMLEMKGILRKLPGNRYELP